MLRATGLRIFTTILLILAVVQASQVCIQAQDNDSKAKAPTFEVVSIRGHKPGYWPTVPSTVEPLFNADGFIWNNAQTQAVITYAFDLRDPTLQVGLIPGAPKWIRSDWFDIRTRLSDFDVEKMKKMNSAQREAYRRQLVQALLADHFRLKAHVVSKEGLAYDLVVAKSGPKNMRLASPGAREGINAVDSGDLQYFGSSLEPLTDDSASDAAGPPGH